MRKLSENQLRRLCRVVDANMHILTNTLVAEPMVKAAHDAIVAMYEFLVLLDTTPADLSVVFLPELEQFLRARPAHESLLTPPAEAVKKERADKPTPIAVAAIHAAASNGTGHNGAATNGAAHHGATSHAAAEADDGLVALALRLKRQPQPDCPANSSCSNWKARL